MLENTLSQDTHTEQEQDTDVSATTKFVPKFYWCYDPYYGWYYC
jgi:hypothetical protein